MRKGKSNLCRECDTQLASLPATSGDGGFLTYQICCCFNCQTVEIPSVYRIVHFGNFCPHCRVKRMNISAKLIRWPNHIRNGEIRIIHECPKCQYQDFEPLTLPLLEYNHQPRSNSKRIDPLAL